MPRSPRLPSIFARSLGDEGHLCIGFMCFYPNIFFAIFAISEDLADQQPVNPSTRNNSAHSFANL